MTPEGDYERPLVTVGIPTWNRAASLERAARSVLAQDYRPLEMVISDNGSTDATADLCARLAASDSRVVYLRHPVNRGATANFMAALTAARGTYFMWLGDDDWLGDGYVRQCVDVLLRDQTFALVAGNPVHHGDSPEPPPRAIVVTDDRPGARVLSYYRQVSDNGIIYGVARRAHLLEIPYHHIFGMDWHFVAALAVRGKLLTIPDVEVHRERRQLPKDEGVNARRTGYPRWHSWFPTLMIGASAVRLLWFGRAYRALPSRFWIGLHAGWICLRKGEVFGFPTVRQRAWRILTTLVAHTQRMLPEPVYSLLRRLYRAAVGTQR